MLVSSSRVASGIEIAATRLARRLQVDELTLQASAALLLSAAVLIGTWWYFSPLLGALLNLFPNVSMTASENLAFLSPAFTPYHQTYRASFIWVTIACLFLWYPVWRRALRTGESLNRGLVAGGLAVTLLSVLLHGVAARRVRIPAELVQTVSLFVNIQPRTIRWNLR
jgi:hypothetical protein